MKKIVVISVVLVIFVFMLSSVAYAGWWSDLFSSFKTTGDATKSCGALGSSQGYAQSQLACYGKTGAAGTSCPSGYSNLGATYDCNYCCAKKSSSTGGSSGASNSCDQTIDRNTGQKCSGNTKNCDCSGACGSSTVCSSPCSGCSGSSSTPSSPGVNQSSTLSGPCSVGYQKHAIYVKKKDCWNGPVNTINTVIRGCEKKVAYSCEFGQGGKQECPPGYRSCANTGNRYVCLKSGESASGVKNLQGTPLTGC